MTFGAGGNGRQCPSLHNVHENGQEGQHRHLSVTMLLLCGLATTMVTIDGVQQ